MDTDMAMVMDTDLDTVMVMVTIMDITKAQSILMMTKSKKVSMVTKRREKYQWARSAQKKCEFGGLKSEFPRNF